MKTGKVIFDLSFNGLMVNREMSSLCTQIMRCYAANRRANRPFNLGVSSFTGDIGERFKAMYSEHERWDMTFQSEHYTETCERDKIIYLTPDSDTVLETIDAEHIYIIGGIVDKNRFKGKTQQVATQLNVKTARLPVPEHIDLKTSPVLTIFHVVEIMLKFMDCNDWKQSLEAFVPQRNMKMHQREMIAGSESVDSMNANSERVKSMATSSVTAGTIDAGSTANVDSDSDAVPNSRATDQELESQDTHK